ncbi:hypothetical protein NPIL_654341 [Nephila pilipes]|uniref:Uncharacterized protein n=1 Tax=Nephila pilipes TaxID=299642 RepID=A0A8X6THL3_NEPPI|nr:hypothetical protein NPIL_654341 [Nephila pilipes]
MNRYFQRLEQITRSRSSPLRVRYRSPTFPPISGYHPISQLSPATSQSIIVTPHAMVWKVGASPPVIGRTFSQLIGMIKNHRPRAKGSTNGT